jgi:hypothetical protein
MVGGKSIKISKFTGGPFLLGGMGANYGEGDLAQDGGVEALLTVLCGLHQCFERRQ